MRNRRETDPGPRQGLRYFTHDPQGHGKVLSIATIKSWFSIRTAKRNKDAVAARDDGGGGGAGSEVHKLKVAELIQGLLQEPLLPLVAQDARGAAVDGDHGPRVGRAAVPAAAHAVPVSALRREATAHVQGAESLGLGIQFQC